MARGSVASAVTAPYAVVAERRTNDVTRIRRFIDEAWSELKKVSWPTRDQVRNLTVLVFSISLVVGLYITVLDTIFQGAVGLLAQPS